MPAGKKFEAIHVENEGGITWLMINRPDKRNAMSPQVHLEMDEVLDELAVDPATEVLVLTGAGNQAFQLLLPRKVLHGPGCVGIAELRGRM